MPIIDDVIFGEAIEVLSDMGEAWGHLTCREADALLALMVAAESTAWAASCLLGYHLEEDDEGDAHGFLFEFDEGPAREAAALDYVIRLVSRANTEEN